MVRNVETGRFERSLSALTAAGALVTAAEIYFEHDSPGFGNKMMWVPVVLGPVGAVAGVAGFCSRRMAKTALPVTSAAIVANGLQGLYLHGQGIAQKPGGWSNVRYNMEMGPPPLVTMVGGRRTYGACGPGLLKGDPDRWGVVMEGLMTKAREILPGKDN
jgi:hypothetical protein